MPESKDLVMNTGPIIALVAALGDLRLVRSLYRRAIVPFEVCREIQAGGISGFAAAQFQDAQWLEKWAHPIDITPYLLNQMDRGEAAVVQMALNEAISTVCIDESVGRRVARLPNLSLTGSIGILLRAKREGYYSFTMRQAIQRMKDKGIWLSGRVVEFALESAGETASLPGGITPCTWEG